MVTTAAAAKKKGRPTSWQRRKQKVGAISKKPEKPIAVLQRAVEEAKAMSQGARDRFRRFLPAEEGDAELAQAYSAAKAALNAFIQSQSETTPNPPTAATQAARSKEPMEEVKKKSVTPAERSQRNLAPVAPAVSTSLETSERKTSAIRNPNSFTAADLGVSVEERRLAKKAAKRAVRKGGT